MIDYIKQAESPTRGSDGFQARDFPLKGDDSNLSEIRLSARYPKTGWVLNTISAMTIYILEGSVTLHQGEASVTFEKGSVIKIPKDQEYYWDPNPEVTLLVFSTPPWSKNQHRNIA